MRNLDEVILLVPRFAFVHGKGQFAWQRAHARAFQTSLFRSLVMVDRARFVQILRGKTIFHRQISAQLDRFDQVIVLVGHVSEQNRFEIQTQDRPVCFLVGDVVRIERKLNRRRRCFEFSIEIGERDTNEMLFVRQNIQMNREEFIENRPK